jgi:hypothetical protein
MSFDDTQRHYFLRELNRAFPAQQRELDTKAMQAALGTSDPELPAAARQPSFDVRLASSFAMERGSSALASDASCYGLTPSSMRADPASRTGCGWWYVNDSSSPSVSAYGTRRGPMNPNMDTMFGQGQWYWNPQDAEKAEAQKQASRVTVCTDLPYAQNKVPNMGWCTATNRAILTDGQGRPKYPRMAGGDCPGGSIVTSAANCPPPAPAAAGGGGGPSISQCTDGNLTPACLAAIAGNECSANGYLAQIYNSGRFPTTDPTFNTTNQLLQQRGFTIDSRLVSDGQMTINSAISAVSNVAQASLPSSSYSNYVQNAAGFLCRGTAFDPCAFQASDSGPFPSECITKMATQQYGFAQSGTALPGGPDAAWPTSNWGAVTAMAQQISTCADQPSTPQAQALCIRQKYGTSVQYPKQGCNNNGIYLYRYYFPQQFNYVYFPSANPTVAGQYGGPYTHFLGRYMFKNGLPQYGLNYNDQLVAGGNLTESQRLIFNWIPTQGGSHQFQVMNDDNMTISYSTNGSPKTDLIRAACCNTAANSNILSNVVPGQVYNMEIDFVNASSAWKFGVLHANSADGSAWSPFAPLPLAEIFLNQDRRLPMIDFSFHKMPQGTNNTQVSDTNGVLSQYSLQGSPIGQVAGRPCMVVSDVATGLHNCLLTYNQGMRLGALKSFTMMVCITAASTQGPPTIFSMYNVSDSASYMGTNPPRSGPPLVSWDYPYRPQNFAVYDMGGGLMTTYSDTSNPSIGKGWQSAAVFAPYSYGQWFHYAFVWDTDFAGYSVYINGQVAGSQRVPAVNPNTILEQVRVGGDQYGWAGGVQWFRAFDYQLSQEQVQMDMTDTWANLI